MYKIFLVFSFICLVATTFSFLGVVDELSNSGKAFFLLVIIIWTAVVTYLWEKVFERD